MGRKKNRNFSPPIDGILLLDKPSGKTSHDLVYLIRRTFNLEKVGHGGTLDPAATGLLVMLLGKGTKASDQIMGGDKVYEGTFTLGVTTDSQDADGEVVDTRDHSAVTQEQVEAAMLPWVGDVEQIPPMVSAIKKDGQPLYKLAREGKVIARDPRPVTIHRFELLGFESPNVKFVTECTKGTYVRTLAYDVGEALGCGAHLSELRRTVSGDYSVDQAVTEEGLLEMSYDDLKAFVQPVPPKPPKIPSEN